MKLIPLTQGYSTMVDDEDFEWLNQWKWYAVPKPNGRVYARAKLIVNGKKRQVRMHRIINNTSHGMDTDHINGNTLDNRKNNLRECTRSENMRNASMHVDNKSGFKGVKQYKDKWASSIHLNKFKKVWLGIYKTKHEAAQAYNEAAIKYFGEFARLNELPINNRREPLIPPPKANLNHSRRFIYEKGA